MTDYGLRCGEQYVTSFTPSTEPVTHEHWLGGDTGSITLRINFGDTKSRLVITHGNGNNNGTIDTLYDSGNTTMLTGDMVITFNWDPSKLSPDIVLPSIYPTTDTIFMGPSPYEGQDDPIGVWPALTAPTPVKVDTSITTNFTSLCNVDSSPVTGRQTPYGVWVSGSSGGSPVSTSAFRLYGLFQVPKFTVYQIEAVGTSSFSLYLNHKLIMTGNTYVVQRRTMHVPLGISFIEVSATCSAIDSFQIIIYDDTDTIVFTSRTTGFLQVLIQQCPIGFIFNYTTQQCEWPNATAVIVDDSFNENTMAWYFTVPNITDYTFSLRSKNYASLYYNGQMVLEVNRDTGLDDSKLPYPAQYGGLEIEQASLQLEKGPHSILIHTLRTHDIVGTYPWNYINQYSQQLFYGATNVTWGGLPDCNWDSVVNSGSGAWVASGGSYYTTADPVYFRAFLPISDAGKYTLTINSPNTTIIIDDSVNQTTVNNSTNGNGTQSFTFQQYTILLIGNVVNGSYFDYSLTDWAGNVVHNAQDGTLQTVCSPKNCFHQVNLTTGAFITQIDKELPARPIPYDTIINVSDGSAWSSFMNSYGIWVAKSSNDGLLTNTFNEPERIVFYVNNLTLSGEVRVRFQSDDVATLFYLDGSDNPYAMIYSEFNPGYVYTVDTVLDKIHGFTIVAMNNACDYDWTTNPGCVALCVEQVIHTPILTPLKLYTPGTQASWGDWFNGVGVWASSDGTNPWPNADPDCVIINATLNPPTADTYTFYVACDDEANFYIDGQQVFNVVGNFGDSFSTVPSFTANLDTNPHLLEVSFKNVQPGWSAGNPAGVGFEIWGPESVPLDNTLQPFTPPNSPWWPDFMNNFSIWGTADGSNPWPVSTPQCVIITGTMTVASDATYVWQAAADDGGNIYIDGNLAFSADAWNNPTPSSHNVFLSAGTHQLLMSVANSGTWGYYNPAGLAVQIFLNGDQIFTTRDYNGADDSGSLIGSLQFYQGQWPNTIDPNSEIVQAQMFTTRDYNGANNQGTILSSIPMYQGIWPLTYVMTDVITYSNIMNSRDGTLKLETTPSGPGTAPTSTCNCVWPDFVDTIEPAAGCGSQPVVIPPLFPWIPPTQSTWGSFMNSIAIWGSLDGTNPWPNGDPSCIILKTTLNVLQDAPYDFVVAVDDEAICYIDGVQIFVQGGNFTDATPPTTYTINLSVGNHLLEISFKNVSPGWTTNNPAGLALEINLYGTQLFTTRDYNGTNNQGVIINQLPMFQGIWPKTYVEPPTPPTPSDIITIPWNSNSRALEIQNETTANYCPGCSTSGIWEEMMDLEITTIVQTRNVGKSFYRILKTLVECCGLLWDRQVKTGSSLDLIAEISLDIITGYTVKIIGFGWFQGVTEHELVINFTKLMLSLASSINDDQKNAINDFLSSSGDNLADELATICSIINQDPGATPKNCDCNIDNDYLPITASPFGFKLGDLSQSITNEIQITDFSKLTDQINAVPPLAFRFEINGGAHPLPLQLYLPSTWTVPAAPPPGARQDCNDYCSGPGQDYGDCMDCCAGNQSCNDFCSEPSRDKGDCMDCCFQPPLLTQAPSYGTFSQWSQFQNTLAVWGSEDGKTPWTGADPFCIIIRTNLTVDDGAYQFIVTVDDVANFYIDGIFQFTVSGNFSTPGVMWTLPLKAGTHLLEISIMNAKPGWDVSSNKNPAGLAFQLNDPNGTQLFTTRDYNGENNQGTAITSIPMYKGTWPKNYIMKVEQSKPSIPDMPKPDLIAPLSVYYPPANVNWNTFMNTLAIWGSEDGVNPFPLGPLECVIIKTTLNITTADEYVFQVAVDDFSIFYIDNDYSFYTTQNFNYGPTYYLVDLAVGVHDLVIYIENIGPWDQTKNPAGLAFSLYNSAGTQLFTTKDYNGETNVGTQITDLPMYRGRWPTFRAPCGICTPGGTASTEVPPRGAYPVDTNFDEVKDGSWDYNNKGPWSIENGGDLFVQIWAPYQGYGSYSAKKITNVLTNDNYYYNLDLTAIVSGPGATPDSTGTVMVAYFGLDQQHLGQAAFGGDINIASQGIIIGYTTVNLTVSFPGWPASDDAQGVCTEQTEYVTPTAFVGGGGRVVFSGLAYFDLWPIIHTVSIDVENNTLLEDIIVHSETISQPNMFTKGIYEAFHTRARYIPLVAEVKLTTYGLANAMQNIFDAINQNWKLSNDISIPCTPINPNLYIFTVISCVQMDKLPTECQAKYEQGITILSGDSVSGTQIVFDVKPEDALCAWLQWILANLFVVSAGVISSISSTGCDITSTLQTILNTTDPNKKQTPDWLNPIGTMSLSVTDPLLSYQGKDPLIWNTRMATLSKFCCPPLYVPTPGYAIQTSIPPVFTVYDELPHDASGESTPQTDLCHCVCQQSTHTPLQINGLLNGMNITTWSGGTGYKSGSFTLSGTILSSDESNSNSKITSDYSSLYQMMTVMNQTLQCSAQIPSSTDYTVDLNTDMSAGITMTIYDSSNTYYSGNFPDPASIMCNFLLTLCNQYYSGFRHISQIEIDRIKALQVPFHLAHEYENVMTGQIALNLPTVTCEPYQEYTQHLTEGYDLWAMPCPDLTWNRLYQLPTKVLCLNGIPMTHSDIEGRLLYTKCCGWQPWYSQNYLYLNPDIKNSTLSPAEHFVYYGAYEGVRQNRCWYSPPQGKQTQLVPDQCLSWLTNLYINVSISCSNLGSASEISYMVLCPGNEPTPTILFDQYTLVNSQPVEVVDSSDAVAYNGQYYDVPYGGKPQTMMNMCTPPDTPVIVNEPPVFGPVTEKMPEPNESFQISRVFGSGNYSGYYDFGGWDGIITVAFDFTNAPFSQCRVWQGDGNTAILLANSDFQGVRHAQKWTSLRYQFSNIQYNYMTCPGTHAPLGSTQTAIKRGWPYYIGGRNCPYNTLIPVTFPSWHEKMNKIAVWVSCERVLPSAALNPIGTPWQPSWGVYMNKFAIWASANATDPWTGCDPYCVIIKTKITVPSDGIYNFNVAVDDEANFYFDEIFYFNVQDNFGGPGENFPVTLTAGSHIMEISVMNVSPGWQYAEPPPEGNLSWLSSNPGGIAIQISDSNNNPIFDTGMIINPLKNTQNFVTEFEMWTGIWPKTYGSILKQCGPPIAVSQYYPLQIFIPLQPEISWGWGDFQNTLAVWCTADGVNPWPGYDPACMAIKTNMNVTIAGSYTFNVTVDDEANFYIDENLFFTQGGNFGGGPATYSINLTAGNHLLEVFVKNISPGWIYGQNISLQQNQSCNDYCSSQGHDYSDCMSCCAGGMDCHDFCSSSGHDYNDCMSCCFSTPVVTVAENLSPKNPAGVAFQLYDPTGTQVFTTRDYNGENNQGTVINALPVFEGVWPNGYKTTTKFAYQESYINEPYYIVGTVEFLGRILIPTTGSYIVQGTADNIGTFFIGGNQVLYTTDNTQWYTQVVTLNAGENVIKIYIENTDNGASPWYGNPAGFAFSLQDMTGYELVNSRSPHFLYLAKCDASSSVVGIKDPGCNVIEVEIISAAKTDGNPKDKGIGTDSWEYAIKFEASPPGTKIGSPGKSASQTPSPTMTPSPTPIGMEYSTFNPDQCVKSQTQTQGSTITTQSQATIISSSTQTHNKQTKSTTYRTGDRDNWLNVDNMYEANNIEIWAKTNTDTAGQNGDNGNILIFDVLLNDKHSNPYYDVVTGNIEFDTYYYKATTYLGVKSPIIRTKDLLATTITPNDTLANILVPDIIFQATTGGCPETITMAVSQPPLDDPAYIYVIPVTSYAWHTTVNYHAVWVSSDNKNPYGVWNTWVYLTGTFNAPKAGNYTIHCAADHEAKMYQNEKEIFSIDSPGNWRHKTVPFNAGPNTLVIAIRKTSQGNVYTDWQQAPACISFYINDIGGNEIVNSRSDDFLFVVMKCNTGLTKDYPSRTCTGVETTDNTIIPEEWKSELSVSATQPVKFRWKIMNASSVETFVRVESGQCDYNQTTYGDQPWVSLPSFDGEIGPLPLGTNNLVGCVLSYNITAFNALTQTQTTAQVIINFNNTCYCPTNMDNLCGGYCYGKKWVNALQTFSSTYILAQPTTKYTYGTYAVWLSSDGTNPDQTFNQWMGIVTELNLTPGPYQFMISGYSEASCRLDGQEILHSYTQDWVQTLVDIINPSYTLEILGYRADDGTSWQTQPGNFAAAIYDLTNNLVWSTLSDTNNAMPYLCPAGSFTDLATLENSIPVSLSIIHVTYTTWNTNMNNLAIWGSEDGKNPWAGGNPNCIIIRTFMNITTEATYQFRVQVDDQAQIYINGELVLSSTDTYNTAPDIYDAHLTIGQYELKIFLMNNAPGWSSGNPAGLAIELYKPSGYVPLKLYTPKSYAQWNTYQNNISVWASADGTNPWPETYPNCVIIKTNMNIATAGTYEFRAEVDDYANFYIDGNLLFSVDDNFGGSPVVFDVALTVGNHKLEISFYNDGPTWSDDNPAGLAFELYDPSGNQVFTTRDYNGKNNQGNVITSIPMYQGTWPLTYALSYSQVFSGRDLTGSANSDIITYLSLFEAVWPDQYITNRIAGCNRPDNCIQQVFERCHKHPCVCPAGYIQDKWECVGKVYADPLVTYTHAFIAIQPPNPYAIWPSVSGSIADLTINKWMYVGWSINIIVDGVYTFYGQSNVQMQMRINNNIIMDFTNDTNGSQINLNPGQLAVMIFCYIPPSTVLPNQSYVAASLSNPDGNLIWHTRTQPVPFSCPDNFHYDVAHQQCVLNQIIPCGHQPCKNGYFDQTLGKCVQIHTYILDTLPIQTTLIEHETLAQCYPPIRKKRPPDVPMQSPETCLAKQFKRCPINDGTNFWTAGYPAVPSAEFTTQCVGFYVGNDAASIVITLQNPGMEVWQVQKDTCGDCTDGNESEELDTHWPTPGVTKHAKCTCHNCKIMSFNESTWIDVTYTVVYCGNVVYTWKPTKDDIIGAKSMSCCQTTSRSAKTRAAAGGDDFLYPTGGSSSDYDPVSVDVPQSCTPIRLGHFKNNKVVFCKPPVTETSGSPYVFVFAEVQFYDAPEVLQKVDQCKIFCWEDPDICVTNKDYRAIRNMTRDGDSGGDSGDPGGGGSPDAPAGGGDSGGDSDVMEAPGSYFQQGADLFPSPQGSSSSMPSPPAPPAPNPPAWHMAPGNTHCMCKIDHLENLWKPSVPIRHGGASFHVWKDYGPGVPAEELGCRGPGCRDMEQTSSMNRGTSTGKVARVNFQNKTSCIDLGIGTFVDPGYSVGAYYVHNKLSWDGVYPISPNTATGASSQHGSPPIPWETPTKKYNMHMLSIDGEDIKEKELEPIYKDLEEDKVCPQGYTYNTVTKECEYIFGIPAHDISNCGVYINAEQNINRGYTLVDEGKTHPYLGISISSLYFNGVKATAKDVEGQMFYSSIGWVVFDSMVYANLNLDVYEECNPISHFVEFGVWESIYLNRCFSDKTIAYINDSCEKLENNPLNRAMGWDIHDDTLFYKGAKASVQNLLPAIFNHNGKWFKFNMEACYNSLLHIKDSEEIYAKNPLDLAKYIIENTNLDICIGANESEIYPEFLLPRYIDCKQNQKNGWTIKQIGHNNVLHKFNNIATKDDIEGAAFYTTEGLIKFTTIGYKSITTNIDIIHMIEQKARFDAHKDITDPADHFIYVGASQGTPMDIMYKDNLYFSKYIDCEQNRYNGWSLTDIEEQGKFLFYKGKLATKQNLLDARFFSSLGVEEEFNINEYMWINNFKDEDEAIVHFISKGAYQGKFGRAFKISPKKRINDEM